MIASDDFCLRSHELSTRITRVAARFPPTASARAEPNSKKQAQPQRQQQKSKKKKGGGDGGRASKLKVLCLHGFTQNAKVFSSRTSNFRRKALKIPGAGKLECVFAESALRVASSLVANPSTVDADDQRSWYSLNEDPSLGTRPVGSVSYAEWQAPLDEVRALIAKEGPFAGILAFSQGGVPAALLAAELSRASLRFAIFVGCFAPKDPVVLASLAGALDGEFVALKPIPASVPTLHVSGDADPFVSRARCNELMDLCENAKLLTHGGGHIMVPKELFPDVKAWLAQC